MQARRVCNQLKWRESPMKTQASAIASRKTQHLLARMSAAGRCRRGQERSAKAVLPPGFIDDERDRVGEVETAVGGTHGNREMPLGQEAARARSPASPRCSEPEQQRVARLEARVAVATRAAPVSTANSRARRSSSRQAARSEWMRTVARSA